MARKPKEFTVKADPPWRSTVTVAWVDRHPDTNAKQFGAGFVCEMTLSDAVRFRDWLDKALAWMEGE